MSDDSDEEDPSASWSPERRTAEELVRTTVHMLCTSAVFVPKRILEMFGAFMAHASSSGVRRAHAGAPAPAAWLRS